MATTQVTEQILDLHEALRGCVQECVVGTAENYVGHGPSGQVYIEASTGHSAAASASGKESVSELSVVKRRSLPRKSHG